MAYVADPSLVNDLGEFSMPSDDAFLDELVAKALSAWRREPEPTS